MLDAFVEIRFDENNFLNINSGSIDTVLAI